MVMPVECAALLNSFFLLTFLISSLGVIFEPGQCENFEATKDTSTVDV